MDRLFFDTNVILDVLEKRAPWFPESMECLSRVRKGDCKGALTGITLSNIAYLQKTVPVPSLYDTFQILREFLDIAVISGQGIDDALKRRVADVEDGFQLAAALEWKATHLITRNVKDFPAVSGLKILSPIEYLQEKQGT